MAIKKPELVEKEFAVHSGAKKAARVLKALGIKSTEQQVQTALSGKDTLGLEKVLDFDVVDQARPTKIPLIYFQLVLIGFEEEDLQLKHWREFFREAKNVLNKMDGNIYASAKAEDITEKVHSLVDVVNANIPFAKMTSCGRMVTCHSPIMETLSSGALSNVVRHASSLGMKVSKQETKITFTL